MLARTRLFEWSGGSGGSSEGSSGGGGAGGGSGIEGSGTKVENNEGGEEVGEEVKSREGSEELKGVKIDEGRDRSDEGREEGRDLSALFASVSEHWPHVAASTATTQCTQAVPFAPSSPPSSHIPLPYTLSYLILTHSVNPLSHPLSTPFHPPLPLFQPTLSYPYLPSLTPFTPPPPSPPPFTLPPPPSPFTPHLFLTF